MLSFKYNYVNIYATFSFFLIIKTPTALKANAINITWVGEIGSPVWGNLSFLFSEFSPSLGTTLVLALALSQA